MKTKIEYPLVDLLDQRWNEVIRHIPDPSADKPTPRPHFTVMADVRHAAQAHGEANNSDPFAAGRAYHYMRQGYLLPSEVLKDASNATATRRHQGVTFPAVRLS